MPGKWDTAMKRLFEAVARDIIAWLFPGARIVGAVSTELHSRDILADELYEVAIGKQVFLLHIELQSRRDEQMAERLLEYNVLATRRYNKRVISCVIYLLDDGTVPVSPLVWRGPDKKQILRFDYNTIELWKLRAEGLLGLGAAGCAAAVAPDAGRARARRYRADDRWDMAQRGSGRGPETGVVKSGV